ncbi:YjbF family lipoprotein [Paracoccus aurantiacus]|uniref:YjbF family lipoprotein n=1 Tax=Paracoccus aurantiacus TaxID=2599412 RepID=A0A5C6S219_9RHOB|nr:YjbF family lipoprotein [Paracoccus aurantiacus]TXB68498.1 YjbF family lipoprotein [Paracoccus aurantiacus]
MTRLKRNAAAFGAAALMLAACGSAGQEDQGSLYGQLRQIAAPAVARATGQADQAAAPEAPLSAEEMAARALAANPAPLILVGLESSGSMQVMAMVGQNGNMRTYMTPNEQALIIRSGMLTGTKGLGHDLSVAEVEGTAALIRARRAGQATRTNRYIGGDGVERPLPMNCTVALGEGKNFSFAGSGWNATQVVETCQGGGMEVQNSYLVTASGQIPVSRQWIGPDLGYVTIQTIRP